MNSVGYTDGRNSAQTEPTGTDFYSVLNSKIAQKGLSKNVSNYEDGRYDGYEDGFTQGWDSVDVVVDPDPDPGEGETFDDVYMYNYNIAVDEGTDAGLAESSEVRLNDVLLQLQANDPNYFPPTVSYSPESLEWAKFDGRINGFRAGWYFARPADGYTDQYDMAYSGFFIDGERYATDYPELALEDAIVEMQGNGFFTEPFDTKNENPQGWGAYDGGLAGFTDGWNSIMNP